MAQSPKKRIGKKSHKNHGNQVKNQKRIKQNQQVISKLENE
jgi:hypothetical protein